MNDLRNNYIIVVQEYYSLLQPFGYKYHVTPKRALEIFEKFACASLTSYASLRRASDNQEIAEYNPDMPISGPWLGKQ